MKQDKQKTNWIIDAALFGGFLGSLWLDLTGVAVHQWLGLSVGALATYHLIKHWNWVKAVKARFFGPPRSAGSQSRTFYAVDAGLAVGFGAIAVTGVVISIWLDLTLASYAIWYTVHVAASVATLALLVLKIGLHWRWIVSVARRSIFPAPALPAPASSGRIGAAQPLPATAQVPLGRRDFVRLMAGVGAVALLAGANALGGIGDDQAEASMSAASTTQTGTTALSTGTTSSCRVRCGKRCSYPGHCRKYTDGNNNGRCDLGECLS